MTIRVLNSLTKKKEDLQPLEGKTIRMYSCGVTVYDRCHIGHARSLYIFDVIKRYLIYRGYDVHFVRNITDIDDKIIAKANELKKTTEEVVRENIALYKKDLVLLGIDEADAEPRATENIKEIVAAIKELISKGFAYESGGDVYYSVRKFQGYGKLSGQSIEHMEEAVRIEAGEKKKDPLDFALWKKSKEGEPSWPSPWGDGRPGWHIECSCMSLKHLKCQTLDIHAGGRDLIFPHHENEIAQSEAWTGKPFAKYWIHHGLLTINGQKMAKSLGNFITIEAALKDYSVDVLKVFFLSSHYGSPVDYSKDKMQDAQKALQRFDTLFWKTHELLKDKNPKGGVEPDFVGEYKSKFIEAMDDDFNTARALAVLFEFINTTNKFIDSFQEKPEFVDALYAAVQVIEDLSKNILGLFGQEADRELSAEDQSLLDERVRARADKDFKRSDELRDALKEKGILVEDSKSGQTWRWA